MARSSNTPKGVIVGAVAETLYQRGQIYGEFSENGRIAQELKDVLRATPNWIDLEPHHREALEVICQKISRIVSGDPYYSDNWHDIQGYAKLIEDELCKKS